MKLTLCKFKVLWQIELGFMKYLGLYLLKCMYFNILKSKVQQILVFDLFLRKF